MISPEDLKEMQRLEVRNASFGNPQSAVRIREKRENIEGLKGWLAVMTAASFAGWAIWFIADCAK